MKQLFASRMLLSSWKKYSTSLKKKINTSFYPIMIIFFSIIHKIYTKCQAISHSPSQYIVQHKTSMQIISFSYAEWNHIHNAPGNNPFYTQDPPRLLINICRAIIFFFCSIFTLAQQFFIFAFRSHVIWT